MKFVLVLAALFAVAVARPEVTNVRFDSDVRVDGYNFAYENSDGQLHEEEGHLKAAGGEVDSISVKGRFVFVADDGVTYTINYLADENGFQPEGVHIPVAP